MELRLEPRPAPTPAREPVLLYDCERDRLEPGEAILLLEDGQKERVLLAELFPTDGEAEVPAAEPTPLPKSKDSWGMVVCFSDGFGWGLASDGRVVCLGRADDVKVAIANPSLKSGNEEIDHIIDLERALQQKESEADGRRFQGNQTKCRAPKSSRPGHKRIRFMRPSRRERTNARQPKKAKKLALHRP